VEKYFENTGRRKRSVARVRMLEGSKVSTINGKPVTEYLKGFTKGELYVERPLIVTGLEKTYYFTAKVLGGGITGQADAIRLGLARALYIMNPELKGILRKEGLVTRDPREVERKKYHQLKARKKPQFSKR
jgi:small subunit ribosomal protein S9